jgi:hypothetical protein
MIDFSYRSYVDLLRHIREVGRPVVPLREASATGPMVILRHDVDYSVRKAREMAAVEQREGVRATYMVLMTSPYYNLLQIENLRALRDIAAMGHEIGLHYDTDACLAGAGEAQAAEIVSQARFLETAADVVITSVAQHNPSVTSTRVSVPGYRDAYAAAYFKEIAYLSDSRRLFGAPDVYAFFRQHARSQLLIHPLWWFDEPVNRWSAFAAIHAAIAEEIDGRLRRMNSSMESDERRLRGA